MAVSVPGVSPITSSSQQMAAPLDTVHADTGAVDRGGIYHVIVTVGAESTAAWDVEHRNAANTANVRAYRVLTAAGNTIQWLAWFNLRAGERVRVVNKTAFS